MMKTFSAALLCAILGMSGTAYSAEPGPEPEMAAQDEQEPFIPITDEMLLNPDPKDWLMHYRTFDFSGYSPLDQINGSNVDQLQLAWMRAMDAGGQEIRPLVYEGIMYVAHAGSDHIQAWDATSGDLIWDYKRELPGNILDYRTAGARTRNLAMYDDKVYHLTRDTYLIALHARTGALVWETQISSLEDGIAHSSGAVVVKGKVLAGRTCSMRSGLRCFISAHDALTGKELWRTHTTPAQGEPGSESWGDLPTEQRVHVSPWGTPGSYDPELDLVYWGVAVPGPYPRIIRRGKWDVGDKTPCELYSNSTLALDPDTGEIKWYYQHLPCDEWDADFVQERTLIDTVVDPDPESVRWINPKVLGKKEKRKVVVTMGEPGGLFVNDRETGEFLWAHPFPFNTTEKFVIRDIDVNTGEVYINMNMVARKLGDTFTVCGHNVKSWWSWSYSPRTNLLYIPFNHACLSQTANLGRADGVDPRFTIPEPGRPADAPAGEMRAIDMATGKEVWRYEERSPNVGSALATGGDLVFFGDLNRRFRAFDAKTGEVLWETIVGSQISGYPITYSVGGRQYVALPVGGIGRGRLKAYAPELEAPLGSNMMVVFTLPK